MAARPARSRGGCARPPQRARLDPGRPRDLQRADSGRSASRRHAACVPRSLPPRLSPSRRVPRRRVVSMRWTRVVCRRPSNVRAKRSPKREMPSRDRVVGIFRGSDPGPSRPLVHPGREPASDELEGPVVERDCGLCAALPKLHDLRNQSTGFGDALGDRARALLAGVARLPKDGASHLPGGEPCGSRPSMRSRGWRRTRRPRTGALPARPPCTPPRRRRPGTRSSCLRDSSAPFASSLRPRTAVVDRARAGATVRRSSRSWGARGGGKR